MTNLKNEIRFQTIQPQTTSPDQTQNYPVVKGNRETNIHLYNRMSPRIIR